MGRIFLARKQEQEKFCQVLDTYHKTLWQYLNTPLFNRTQDKDDTYVMLFHGAGGMGKSSLLRQLRKLVEEKPYEGKFNILWLDWEKQKNSSLELQVGHDNIKPETVLATLHEVLNNAGWGNYFDEYRRLTKKLKEAEKKVEEELKKPENKIEDKVAKLGAKGLTLLFRRLDKEGEVIPHQKLEPALEEGLKIGAEGVYEARQYIQNRLTPEEYEIFSRPEERLGKALGQGIAKLSQKKPLVIFYDTYEIVDRPECDYTLRTVMQKSGRRTLWLIAGRANLENSGKRGKDYFRGYNDDFEERLYARGLSEFTSNNVKEYFEQAAPQRPLEGEKIESLTQFSLGIPFVIAQAAAMWQEGKKMGEIVAPVEVELGKTTAYQEVVKKTCERFLVHCFSAPEKTKELTGIYGLALLRRPQPELLREMLEVTDLEAELQSLRQRYSFILVEELRLDEKLAQFLQDYLLAPVRRHNPLIVKLNENALAWLELELEELTKDITDTAEQLQEERITATIADLIHHRFWQGEDEGWRYFVPWFVVGCQYNLDWVKSLLEVVESFQSHFSGDGQRRLKLFREGLDLKEVEKGKRLLEELEKLQRRDWLKEEEYGVILQLQQGQLLFHQERYKEALQVCLEVERRLPVGALQLREDLAECFYQLCGEFTWPKDASSSVYTTEGKEAIDRAISLNSEDAYYYYYLGVIYDDAKQPEEALAAYQKAIELDPKLTYPHNGLGIVYYNQGKLEEALAAYQTAIELDPKLTYPHNGLGNVYQNQGKLEEAITTYQKAIELDPKDASNHNNLGNVYDEQGKLEEAITAYQKAIELKPNSALYHDNLGDIYRQQGEVDKAIKAYKKAIKLDSEYYWAYRSLGNVYDDQEKYEKAIAAYQKAIEIKPDNSKSRNDLGLVYEKQGKLEEAIKAYKKAIELDSEYYWAYRNLGNVYEEQEKYEKAIAAYQKAIAIKPDYDSAYNRLGWTYLLQNELTKAAENFNKAIELDPKESCYVFNLGLVYARQGEMETARQQWQKGLTLCQADKAWDKAFRALYTLALGNKEQGLTEMQQLMAEENVSVRALRDALDDAKILVKCPTPPEGIGEMVGLLEEGVRSRE